MKTFHLQRDIDSSGVSGTGRVAEGVVFDNGRAVIYWNTKVGSIAIYDSIDDVESIHGHGGNTKIVFDSNDS